MGAELFHAEGRADRQTYVTKLIVTFRNFANASKNFTTMLKYHGNDQGCIVNPGRLNFVRRT